MKKSTAIKVSNVSKSFGVPHEKRETVKSYFVNPFRRTHKDKFDALKNINFEIKKGEFVGIVGRNGSGKSTLLKLLAGIYVPNEGGVNVQGRVVPFLELGVGFSQELSGRENIFLNGTILGMKKKFLEQKYNEIVAFAELEDFMDLPLKNYSSGMQVRLAFSIAMQADADVYLLDEILAVGDAAFQQKSLEEFKRLKKEGKTIIFVSHSPETITKYSDRVLYLKEGEVADIGDAVEVVDR
ncbi:MAG TPA: ABC transporter ATP-binding protein, partial [bacterium]|nr:ABC transporter ATP-binding protein [bacterium]